MNKLLALGAVIVGLSIWSLVGIYLYDLPDMVPAPYHLAVHCGEMGDYKVEPGSIKYTPDGKLFTAVKMGGHGAIKFPSYCVVETVNFPLSLADRVQQEQEQGV